MNEALKEEAIVNKVGGRFKLSTLIQKRLVALNAGARPLVDAGSEDKLEIIVQEILQDKIYLDMSNELKTVAERLGLPAPGVTVAQPTTEDQSPSEHAHQIARPQRDQDGDEQSALQPLRRDADREEREGDS